MQLSITISIRFYGDLNNTLPMAKRARLFKTGTRPQQRIGELIQTLGVSLLEIDLMLVNGEAAGFDYTLKENDRISVYPLFRSIDIRPENLINRGYTH